MSDKDQIIADRQAKAHEIVEQIRGILVQKRDEIHGLESNEDGSIIKISIEDCISPFSVVSQNNKSNGWPSIFGFISISSLPVEQGKADFLNYNLSGGGNFTHFRINTFIDDGELAVVINNTCGNRVDIFEDEKKFVGVVPDDTIFNEDYTIKSPENMDFLGQLIDGFIKYQLPRLQSEGLNQVFKGATMQRLGEQLQMAVVTRAEKLTP